MTELIDDGVENPGKHQDEERAGQHAKANLRLIAGRDAAAGIVEGGDPPGKQNQVSNYSNQVDHRNSMRIAEVKLRIRGSKRVHAGRKLPRLYTLTSTQVGFLFRLYGSAIIETRHGWRFKEEPRIPSYQTLQSLAGKGYLALERGAEPARIHLSKQARGLVREIILGEFRS